MRSIYACLSATILLSVAASATAQGLPASSRPEGGVEDFIARLMVFDTDGDGRLTKQEVTDERLHPLVDRLDTNRDGQVTKDEMTVYFTKESEAIRNNGGRDGFGAFGPPLDGRGPGQGPPGARNPGQPPRGDAGVRGDEFAPPRPGQVLPMRLQEELQLTQQQKTDLAKLQADVDARLNKILTKTQQQQLDEMRHRGPGIGGPPGGVQPPEGRGPPMGPKR